MFNREYDYEPENNHIIQFPSISGTTSTIGAMYSSLSDDERYTVHFDRAMTHLWQLAIGETYYSNCLFFQKFVLASISRYESKSTAMWIATTVDHKRLVLSQFNVDSSVVSPWFIFNTSTPRDLCMVDFNELWS